MKAGEEEERGPLLIPTPFSPRTPPPIPSAPFKVRRPLPPPPPAPPSPIIPSAGFILLQHMHSTKVGSTESHSSCTSLHWYINAVVEFATVKLPKYRHSSFYK